MREREREKQQEVIKIIRINFCSNQETVHSISTISHVGYQSIENRERQGEQRERERERERENREREKERRERRERERREECITAGDCLCF